MEEPNCSSKAPASTPSTSKTRFSSTTSNALWSTTTLLSTFSPVSSPSGSTRPLSNSKPRNWTTIAFLFSPTESSMNAVTVKMENYTEISPVVSHIVPNSVYPGQKIKLYGFLKISQQKMYYISFGEGFRCGIEDDSLLKNQWSYHESLECKLEDIVASTHDLKVRVNDDYGFALVARSAKSSDIVTGKLHALKVFPVISKISQNQIYQSGGIIEIEGSGFGKEMKDLTIELQFQNSSYYSYKIPDFSDKHLKVEFLNKGEEVLSETPDKVFLGGQGLLHRMIPVYMDLEHFQNSLKSYPDHPEQVLSLKLSLDSFENKDNYVQRYSGAFKSLDKGTYKFWVSSDDQSVLKLHKIDFKKGLVETEAHFKCSFNAWTSYRAFFQFKEQFDSCEFELEENTFYHIIALQREGGGGDHLTVALSMPHSSASSREDVHPQITQVIVKNTPILEQLTITQINAEGGTFDLIFAEQNSKGQLTYKKTVDLIPFNATSDDLKKRIYLQTKWDFSVEREFLNSQKEVVVEEAQAKGFRWTITFTTERKETMLPFPLSKLKGLGVEVKSAQKTLPSPRLAGSFKLKIGEQTTKAIPINSGWEVIFNEIRMLDKFKSSAVSVSIHGNDMTGRIWNIIFDGRPEVPVEIVAQDSSRLFHYSVPSQLLRTVNDKPQLNIKVGDDYAVCPDRSCHVETIFLANIPYLQSYSISLGKLEVNLAEGYQNIESEITKENIRVYFAGWECDAILVSLPKISCNLLLNASNEVVADAGFWKPQVGLINKGNFQQGSLTETEYKLIIDDFTPISGSTGGNTRLTIRGQRFDENIKVQIGSNDCVILEQTFSQVVCMTGPNEPNSYEVRISQNGQNAAFITKFEYKSDTTPTVTGISPSSANPVLRTTLTVSGRNFIEGETEVTLQKQDDPKIMQKCFVLSLNATQIVCKLAGGLSGTYFLKVVTKVGSSIENTLFKYESTITAIDRTSGSTAGGSLITIKGTNFSSEMLDQQVGLEDFRESYFCDIQSAEATEIKCVTRPLKAGSLWADKEIPLFIKLKLSEDAKCLTKCSFKFDSQLDYQITAINQSEFQQGQNITLTYNKPIPSTDMITLKLKNTEEEFELKNPTISAQQVTFVMPSLKTGTFTLQVSSSQNGNHVFMTKNTIKNVLKISSVTPSIGYFGGQEVTIIGNGFYEGLEFFVKNDALKCIKLQFVSPTEVKCYINFTTANQTNLGVYTKHEQVQINCDGCSYATLPDNIISSLISMTSSKNQESIKFDITFSKETDPTTINQVSFLNLLSQEEFIGSFLVRETKVVELNFSHIPIGNYRILVKSTRGFFKVVEVFQVQNDPTLNNVSSVVSSFLGGATGTFDVGLLGQEPVVSVCGFEAVITKRENNLYTYETPAFMSKETVDKYKLFQPEKLSPTLIISKNINFKERLVDNDLSVSPVFENYCNFVFDFGEGFKAYLSVIKLFPYLNTNIDMNDAILEGSNDNSTFELLHEYKSEIQENWKEVSFAGPKLFRFIKFSAIRCQVAEFEVYGVKVRSEAIQLSSHKCDLKIMSGEFVLQMNQQIEYRSDKTPEITAISPKNISSKGGELSVQGSITNECFLTLDRTSSSVSGQNLNTKTVFFSVGARTEIVAHSLEIMCPHGRAALMGNDAYFADRWSDNATWGGDFLPAEGESVHVPKGQTLLVDISPPKMKLIMVEGKLLFEDKDLNFEAHYIIVREGEMRAGYEDAPFENKLTITLHGDKYDRTLPGMGNKLIGVVNGELYLFGAKRTPTWTSLQTTAVPNDATITLTQAVNWKVGDKIVISTTGLNKDEFEVRYIKAIDVNQTILTLDEPLNYNHYAGQLTRDGATHQLRAKVAVFSRQIVVQGDETTDETKHGVHVMLRGASGKVKGQISQVEVRKCGQLFNMGRYPLHFHMIGNVNGSYIDGVSVFNSFNRGTTVHGVHYLQIKNSVYYEHFGHGIFIEDSVESLNTIENNLVMKTKKATALLESDLKPAAMWITRPSNFIRNNVAIGSSHFGFWYDLPNRATGPSANVKNVCPVGDQLGAFEGNESHGNGIGLRIYPQYLPRTYQCSEILNLKKLNPFEDNPSARQVFKNGLIWNNSQGFFNRKGGTFTLDGFTFISNNTAVGFSEPQFQILSAMTTISNSTIIGKSEAGDLHQLQTWMAISLGRKEGFIFKNIKIHDFSQGTFVSACSDCDPLNPHHMSKGCHVTHFEGFTFSNAVFSQKVKFTEPSFGMDLLFDDGSLLGMGAATITPYLKHLDSEICTKVTDEKICSDPCLICPSAKLIRRLEVQNHQANLKGLNLKVFNMGQGEFKGLFTDDQFSVIKYREEADTGFAGWSFPVVMGENYNLHFSSGEEIQSIQVQNNFYWNSSDRVLLNFNITSTPELFDVSFTGFNKNSYVENLLLESDASLEQKSDFAVFSWEALSKSLKVGISGSNQGKVKIEKIFCRFHCPANPDEEKKDDFSRYWSKPQNWPQGAVPAEGADVIIEGSWNMIYDLEESPVFNSLTIKGRLEVNNDKSSYVLRAKRIIVQTYGEFMIGDESTVFTKKFSLVLHGAQEDEQTALTPLIEPTNKSLVNYGLFMINSISAETQYAKLAQNARIDEATITLAKAVDWKVGDEIAISSTSQDHSQYEKVTITKIESNVISFTPALRFNHYGYGTINTLQGVLDMRAEVVHLSRNVQIIGDLEGNWGCTIQTIGFSDLAVEKYYQGQTKLKGVEIKNCGQLNKKYGALAFINLNAQSKASTFENSVIKDSLGIALTATNSMNLNFVKNNIFDAVKTGVYFNQVSQGDFSNNILLGVKKREDYTNHQVLDLLNGFEYHSKNFLEQDGFVIKNNIISSAPWFAWVVPGHSCTTTTPNFSDNVGHSSMAGWFGNRVNAECQRYSNFVGYKNSEQGLVNRFLIHKLKVENCLFSDNGNSIALNGGSRKEEDFPFSEVKNTVVIGQAQENCDFCYDNEKDCKTNGIITSLFEMEDFSMDFNTYRLPLHNVTFTDFLWGGKQTIDSVQFKNFNNQKESCKKSDIFVIRTNQFTQDTSVRLEMTGVTLENVDERNKFFFYNHTRLTHPSFCQKRDCTGIYNILIDDLNGGFSVDKKPQQFFGHNKKLNDGNCTFVKEWNGHQCNRVYQVLSIKKTDRERSPVISPIVTSISKFASESSEFQAFQNSIDNMDMFPNIVKINSYHRLQFSQSLKNNNIFKLDSFDPSQWAVFSIQNTDPAIMVPYVNGKMKAALRIDNNVETEWIKHVADCGANVYEEATKTLTWIMNGSKDCIIQIRMKNALYVALVFEMDTSAYYETGGDSFFIDRISNVLGIHPSTLKIVGVKKGSTHIDFVIFPEEEENKDAASTPEISQAAQLEQIKKLDSINKKLAESQKLISEAMKSPIKSYLSTLVVANNDFQKFCRFYNYQEVLFVGSHKESDSLAKDARDFRDFNCSSCTQKDDCLGQLSSVCKLFKDFLGSKCLTTGEQDKIVEKSGQNPENEGTSTPKDSILTSLFTCLFYLVLH